MDDRHFIDISTEDWNISPSGSIETRDGTAAVKAAVLRAVVTPHGWIGRWALDEGDLTFLDGDYGDRIYEEVAEPLTPSWLPRARTHIAEAIAYSEPDATLIDIEGEYRALTGVPDGAIIYVTYSVNNIEETLEVPLP